MQPASEVGFLSQSDLKSREKKLTEPCVGVDDVCSFIKATMQRSERYSSSKAIIPPDGMIRLCYAERPCLKKHLN